MEKRNKERLAKLIKEHKAELKRARSDNDSGLSSGGYKNGGGGYQGSGGDGGERDYKKPRLKG